MKKAKAKRPTQMTADEFHQLLLQAEAEKARQAREARAIDLTDDERSSVAHHLRIAAEQYDRDVVDCEKVPHQRLAETFREQAAQARRLAVRFEHDGDEAGS